MNESNEQTDAQTDEGQSSNELLSTAAAPACTTGRLTLQVNDWRGRPIGDLPVLVKVSGQVVFDGKADKAGQFPPMDKLPLGSPFEIHVKKDKGGYKLVAIGMIEAEETNACLTSPKLRFEFSTYPHEGNPGHADTHRQNVIADHNQKPSAERTIFGTDKPPQIKAGRNDKGHPKALVLEGVRDSFNRNVIHGGTPEQTHTDVEYVKRLIEFGEKQAKWRYDERATGDTYILQMDQQTFKEPPAKNSEGYQNSIGYCNKYVKIALWYAGYNPPLNLGQAPKSIGAGVVQARLMGPELEKAGFKNVTSLLSDARWAAPGDVIVYKKKGEPNHPGHIDIRTYDGYLSDFLGLYLPIRKFTVTGIYRKHSDLQPEKRMRAFLMVIASREARAIFESEGYEQVYRTLPVSGKFSSFKTHPFENSPPGTASPSGAYGTTVGTWKLYLPFLDLSATVERFSPNIQDRIAATIMEQNGNALELVRQGKIEDAAKRLATVQPIQWSSLPGGKESHGYTAAEMMDKYNRFLAMAK